MSNKQNTNWLEHQEEIKEEFSSFKDIHIFNLNKESLEKSIFCDIMKCLFDGDLMMSEVGKRLRANIKIEELI